MDDVFKYAPLVFLVVSYIIWAATGLNLAILDAMALLRRSTKQSSRFELEDLVCVTVITDREFVAGFLAHILPPLYLRIVAGVGLGWLIMLMISTEWISTFSNETTVLIALSPISIGLWSASGCIGVTALIAFYLALGSGRSTIPASMASLVVLGSQGIWLITSVVLVIFITEEPFGSYNSLSGSFDNYPILIETIISQGASMLAPLVFVGLVAWGLHLTARYPVLKPVQAIGGPLLVPVLAMIFTILVVANADTYLFGNGLYIFQTNYIWHFGDMLPLNFGILSFPVFYTGDALGSSGGTLNLWYRPLTIFLAQLALLIICLGYAKHAVGERRRAR